MCPACPQFAHLLFVVPFPEASFFGLGVSSGDIPPGDMKFPDGVAELFLFACRSRSSRRSLFRWRRASSSRSLHYPLATFRQITLEQELSGKPLFIDFILLIVASRNNLLDPKQR